MYLNHKSTSRKWASIFHPHLQSPLQVRRGQQAEADAVDLGENVR